jgi:hypothetical protein
VGVTALLTGSTQPAAAALVQFPASELHNHYVLVRAGESDSESQDVVLTNPAWKTSMASGLSQRGKAQVRVCAVGSELQQGSVLLLAVLLPCALPAASTAARRNPQAPTPHRRRLPRS